MNEKRIVGLDLVRVVAIVLVISLHFILHSNYYAIPLRGIGMFLLTMYVWMVSFAMYWFIFDVIWLF